MHNTMACETLFTHTIRAMQYAGIWPVKDKNKCHHYLSFMLIPVLLIEHIYEIVVLRMLDIYHSWDQPLLICEDAVSITMSIMFLAKVGTIYWQPKKMQNLHNKMQRIYDTYPCENQYYMHLVSRVKLMSYWLIRINTVFSIIYMVLYTTHHAMSNVTNRTPIQGGRFPYDVSAWPNYELTLLQQFITMEMFMIINILTDQFTLSMLAYGIIQFKILCHRLKNLQTISEKTIKAKFKIELSKLKLEIRNYTMKLHVESLEIDLNNIRDESITSVPEIYDRIQPTDPRDRYDELLKQMKWEVDLEMQRRMKECIKQHQTLLSFVSDFEEAFKWSYLLFFLVIIIPCGIMAVYISMVPKMDSKSEGIMGLLTSSIVDLLLHCTVADILASESSKVREAVYACDWTEASESFKKSMRIMMSRVNQPAVITVAGYIPLTLETFLAVMNTSYSYYMTMLTVASPPEAKSADVLHDIK